MRLRGLKAWAFLVVVLIGIIFALLLILGFIILLLPLISLSIILYVIYALIDRLRSKRKKKKKERRGVIDVEFKVRKEGKKPTKRRVKKK